MVTQEPGHQWSAAPLPQEAGSGPPFRHGPSQGGGVRSAIRPRGGVTRGVVRSAIPTPPQPYAVYKPLRNLSADAHSSGTIYRMTRPLRLEFAGALYHGTSRGDRRGTIYRDTDRIAWQELLALVCERYHFVVHSFCQMREAGSGPPFRHGPSHIQPKTTAQSQCQCVRLRYPVPYDATTTVTSPDAPRRRGQVRHSDTPLAISNLKPLRNLSANA